MILEGLFCTSLWQRSFLIRVSVYRLSCNRRKKESSTTYRKTSTFFGKNLNMSTFCLHKERIRVCLLAGSKERRSTCQRTSNTKTVSCGFNPTQTLQRWSCLKQKECRQIRSWSSFCWWATLIGFACLKPTLLIGTIFVEIYAWKSEFRRWKRSFQTAKKWNDSI